MDYAPLFQHVLFQSRQRIALLCNQSSYDFAARAYLFDLLIAQKRLHRLLMPEHGLFAEKQDQEGQAHGLYQGVECRSLYDPNKAHVVPDAACLEGCDALLIDVPNVGARYYTYHTHLYWLLRCLRDHHIRIPVWVVDRPNLAGHKMEGTPMPARYASFVGLEGLLHRHGMSTGQLVRWMCGRLRCDLPVYTTPLAGHAKSLFIPPSPNIAHLSTVQTYAGQCLWEATTWSEGRGTTRPFELFGHPQLYWEACVQMAKLFNSRFAGQALLRPARFIPTFHKHQGEVCSGFQLHILAPESYHSLWGTLYAMRLARALTTAEAFWRSGTYEFDSPCTAAQVLVGDDLLIAFVNGEASEQEAEKYLRSEEALWRRTALQLSERTA